MRVPRLHPEGLSPFEHRLVLFDLDGVLVDSREAMSIAWSAVRRDLGISVQFDDYVREIGRPFAEIVARLGLDERLADIERVYWRVAAAEIYRVKPYPHVIEGLRRLTASGKLVGVVTSKERSAAIRTLKQFGVPFAVVKTPDDGPGKPAPDLLTAAVRELGMEIWCTIYIGDMRVDYEAACNAGIRFLHAAWGYGIQPDGTRQLHRPRDIGRLARVDYRRVSAARGGSVHNGL